MSPTLSQDRHGRERCPPVAHSHKRSGKDVHTMLGDPRGEVVIHLERLEKILERR